MQKAARGRPAGVTLRARASVLVGIALLALAALLLADALLRGRWDVAVLSLPALGLVACLAVEVFLRPGIRVHHGGITVINPLHTVEVPWSQVAGVTTRFLVSIETVGGGRIRSWGAPSAARSRPTRARSVDSTDADAGGWLRPSSPHRVIESYVAQFGSSALPAVVGAPGAAPRRRWHTTTAGVAGALVLVAVFQLLIGG
ncbi:PH domain-containing protein [Cryobacterium sp. SO2]|uniref:PH domain-containing protein n=1 Tax=Cryobacterium sp. SO2 TaxID=1897060 RepID=UPI00223E0A03|nr:PH domain-containing protein [Cryobacterium sp. SO2]WEO78509.1 PH domain-containing protein [Cryobacterium sp. SO2]